MSLELCLTCLTLQSEYNWADILFVPSANPLPNLDEPQIRLLSAWSVYERQREQT